MSRLKMPGRRVWIALAVAVAVAVMLGISSLLGSRPAITGDGPVAPCPDSPNCARVAVEYAADPIAVVDAVHRQLPTVPGVATVQPMPTGALAEFTAGPFSDDVAVEVAEGPRGATLWVRSASRTGRSDLGVNARRVDRIVEAVSAWLPPEAPVSR